MAESTEEGTLTIKVEPAIRKLNKEEQEIFGGAVVRAYIMLPAFRDAIALMRPFVDNTADTAYTDPYSRVGLSPWFFNDLDVYQRASVILHEAYHVLNNTFTREAALGADPDLGNIASDLEINSNLSLDPQIDLFFGVMPDRKPFDFKLHQTMEQYYHLIMQDPELMEQLRQDRSKGADRDCPVHGTNPDNQGQPGQTDESGSDEGEGPGQGEEPGDSGSGGDQPGNDGADGDEGQGGSGGDADGEGNGDSGDSGSGSGEGDPNGTPQPNHSHGNTGPQCSCPHNSSGGGSPKPGTPSTKGCDQSTEDRSNSADDAGIERASEAEQTIAKNNTAALIEEELKQARAAGNGTRQEFLSLMLTHMKPPQIDWRRLLSRTVSKMEEAIARGRTDYSYRRPSRRMSGSKYIFPGQVEYKPSIMYGVDTSGSMSEHDHLRVAREVEGILRSTSRMKGGLRMFSVDTTVQNCKLVDRVEQLNLRGGGGTSMEVAWEFIRTELPKKQKPNIFVLGTDGHLGSHGWANVEEEVKQTQKAFRSIILVTTSMGFESVPESLKKIIPVFDISEDDKNY